MFTSSVKQIVGSVVLGLGLAVLTFTAPMTDNAQAATSKTVPQPIPTTGYTMHDMHDCVPSGSNSEFVCTGPDNRTYVCKTTGSCRKLDW